MRDAIFHTLVAVAAQQSGSKSCGLYCMGRAPGASLQGEDPDHGAVAAVHYGGVGTRRPATRVIDNAVKQWRKRVRACVTANSGHFEHLL